MTGEKFKYEYWRYDKHFTLKPSLALQLIVVFLCKDLMLSLLLGFSKFKTRGGSVAEDAATLIQPIFIISNLPASAVLLAMLTRGPTAGPAIRLIWKGGRYLIGLSILIYLATFVTLRGADVFDYTIIDWGAVTLHLVIVGYIFSSKLVRDIFAEFPEPPK